MLTDAKVRSAKPREKPYKLTDERGLFLLVNPAGSRLWRFKYRWQGREQLLSVGPYPEVSLGEAREVREAHRKLLAAGRNPSLEKKLARVRLSADTFGALFSEWYERQLPDWAPTNAKKVARLAERDLLPWLKDRPVQELTAPELLACLRRIESRGALETAHRGAMLIGNVLAHALHTGRIDRDPAPKLSAALKSPVRRARAAVTEAAQVGQLIRAIRGYKGSSIVRTALQLSALTFLRPGELRQARWSDIDFEKSEWLVSVEHRKLTAVAKRTAEAHLVPLSTQAAALLKELWIFTGSSGLVFPSFRSVDRPMSDGTVIAALRTLGYSKTEMSAHGFRAMASTLLNEQGWNRDAVERQLAHRDKDAVRAAYARGAYLEERRRMMQAWADCLDKLARGELPASLPPQVGRS